MEKLSTRPSGSALLVSHGRPGFYLRVIEEGEVEAGEEIIEVASAVERMSVAGANALLYLPGHRREDLQRALGIPALSPGWKASFQALLEQILDVGTTNGNRALGACRPFAVAACLARIPSRARRRESA